MTLEVRQLFDKGDALFTQQRQNLDLDAALDIENYSDEASRANCAETLSTYLNQLDLEKHFYEKTSAEFFDKLMSLLSQDVRILEDYKERVIPRVMEGTYLRLNINREKHLAISKAKRVITIFDEVHEKGLDDAGLISLVDDLCVEVDQHLENQYDLAQKQRQNNIDGNSRLQNILLGLESP